MAEAAQQVEGFGPVMGAGEHEVGGCGMDRLGAAGMDRIGLRLAPVGRGDRVAGDAADRGDLAGLAQQHGELVGAEVHRDHPLGWGGVGMDVERCGEAEEGQAEPPDKAPGARMGCAPGPSHQKVPATPK